MKKRIFKNLISVISVLLISYIALFAGVAQRKSNPLVRDRSGVQISSPAPSKNIIMKISLFSIFLLLRWQFAASKGVTSFGRLGFTHRVGMEFPI